MRLAEKAVSVRMAEANKQQHASGELVPEQEACVRSWEELPQDALLLILGRLNAWVQLDKGDGALVVFGRRQGPCRGQCMRERTDPPAVTLHFLPFAALTWPRLPALASTGTGQCQQPQGSGLSSFARSLG